MIIIIIIIIIIIARSFLIIFSFAFLKQECSTCFLLCACVMARFAVESIDPLSLYDLFSR